ncbi:contact-dependent growth inhibition system immunity protein [Alisedimentitalea sp. MJ-SS2]|uniref:contact-dependent growth inhibition system immunity protein n=1 Tax=Aliisedimentitalea sp. MJ-SS2 TaxID=3049795 RepID=UPI002906FE8D|nr:contact-dependent growth inhibition system immunity protein [Alisedimentitalea sp. MJ-SS2]MDU8929206.1 contact-dependent growth inhibition system immunity protein [Alisedimentitalea sp. MJ-SS2]
MAYIADKTLEEIDGERWPMPCCASYIEATCAVLRKKPLGMFTIEDLRMMIAQDIGAEVLKPLVMERLAENPLAEGDYYPGDLLEAAARRWTEDTDLQDLARAHGK